MFGLNFARHWHGGCAQVHPSDHYGFDKSWGRSPTLVTVNNGANLSDCIDWVIRCIALLWQPIRSP